MKVRGVSLVGGAVVAVACLTGIPGAAASPRASSTPATASAAAPPRPWMNSRLAAD
jgi:hypothetical protein